MREMSPVRQSTPTRPFTTPTMIRLLGRELQQASRVLASACGANALFVRPDARAPMSLHLPLLHQQIRLHRQDNGFAGDVIAHDAALPFASESFSLVMLQHVIETAADAGGLLDEAVRVLTPEGNLVLIGFKPFAPMRLRWRRAGLRVTRAATMSRLLALRGLDVRRACDLGSVWRIPEKVSVEVATSTSPLASTWLLIARKRVAGVTPLPAGNAHVVWSTGRVRVG